MLDGLREDLCQVEQQSENCLNLAETVRGQKEGIMQEVQDLFGEMRNALESAIKAKMEEDAKSTNDLLAKTESQFAARFEAITRHEERLDDLKNIIDRTLLERKGMLQNLFSLQTVSGEHAVDIQWLYAHARWSKMAVDELQGRSFIKLPTKAPPSPTRTQQPLPASPCLPPSTKGAQGELPPLGSGACELGALRWRDEPPGAAASIQDGSAATTENVRALMRTRSSAHKELLEDPWPRGGKGRALKPFVGRPLSAAPGGRRDAT